MNLPAGILPEDCNIELFANPEHFGKCLFIQNGKTKPFHELPTEVLPYLYNECFSDKKAVETLRLMGVMPEHLVEHYNFCNRGKLDSIPDISESKKLHKEYFDCGNHDKCIGDGIVCGKTGLTFRERQCLKLAGLGKSYEQIKSEMGFKNKTAVNSLMSRLKEKCNVDNKTELSIYARKLGVI